MQAMQGGTGTGTYTERDKQERIPLGPEDAQEIFETMYRQLNGVVVFLGQKLGKKGACCPNCGGDLKK